MKHNGVSGVSVAQQSDGSCPLKKEVDCDPTWKSYWGHHLVFII